MSDNQEHNRSPCPIACALDLLGDKWTLLVLRDLFLGKRRYRDFRDSPEGIPTNILAERLKRLERGGLISKTACRPESSWYEYSLTQKGQDLLPVLLELSKWGNKHIPNTWVPPESFAKKSS